LTQTTKTDAKTWVLCRSTANAKLLDVMASTNKSTQITWGKLTQNGCKQKYCFMLNESEQRKYI